MNGLLETFEQLSHIFQGEFLITPAVKYESIEHPLQIKRFEWGALRINKLLEDEVIKSIEDEDPVSKEELNKKTQEILDSVNSSFSLDGKQIYLIEKGEAECLAMSLLLKEHGIDSAVVIDERTARMICENPENLEKIMETKLHTNIKINFNLIKQLQKLKIIRSTELMYMAYKKNILDKDKKTLEAVLYALKFGGCSISEKEVDIMKNMN
jgi:predicted nucleic acid-binding protein